MIRHNHQQGVFVRLLHGLPDCVVEFAIQFGNEIAVLVGELLRIGGMLAVARPPKDVGIQVERREVKEEKPVLETF